MTDSASDLERRPLEHFAERSLAGLAATLAAGVGFAFLLLLVRGHWSPLNRLDRSVAVQLNELVAPHPGVVSALQMIAGFGGRPIMWWIVGVTAAGLAIRRQHRLAVYLLITGVGALIMDPTLKLIVGRLRPEVPDPVTHAPGNSFPSGHALGSIVAYGALLLVFLPAIPRRWRAVAVAATGLLVASIGFTRIALGVHYLSDVVGAWLLGAAWLGITAGAFALWRRETGAAPAHAVTDGLAPEASDDLHLTAPRPGRAAVGAGKAAAELLVGAVFVYGLVCAFGFLLTRYGLLAGVDRAVPEWFAAHRSPGLTPWSELASQAGNTHAILGVSLIVCPLLVAAIRSWRPVVFIAVTMFGELALFLGAQAVIDRPRPEVPQLDHGLPTSAFPSGHVAATFCLFTAIAIVVLPRTRAWWQWLPVVAAVVMPTAVALSRLYRGAHHLGDLLGSLLLAVPWLICTWWVLRPNRDLPGGAHDSPRSWLRTVPGPRSARNDAVSDPGGRPVGAGR